MPHAYTVLYLDSVVYDYVFILLSIDAIDVSIVRLCSICDFLRIKGYNYITYKPLMSMNSITMP